MTTITLDEQVAKLMRLVNELCADSYDDGYQQRPFNPSRMEIYADVEAFARAALERLTVPEGWQLVPIDPTDRMLTAFHASIGVWLQEVGTDSDIWIAMLDAAPPAPKETP